MLTYEQHLVDEKGVENILVYDNNGNEFSVYFEEKDIIIYTKEALTVSAMSLLMVTLLNIEVYKDYHDVKNWTYNYDVKTKKVKVKMVT